MEPHEKELHGIQGGVDNIGVGTVTIPYVARTLEECFTVAIGRSVYGLPEKSRSFQHFEGGIFTVNVVYEGQNPATSSAVKRAEDVQYSLRSAYEESPIEMHPRIDELVEKYGGRWDNGRVIFPPLYKPYSNLAGVGLTRAVGADQVVDKNPMCGVEKFKELGVVWQRTYAAKEIPADVLSRVGRFIGIPPGTPPELRGQTKWLVLPPSVTQRGNVVEVTEEYQLLKPGEEIIYSEVGT